jgi:CHASE3 domain sensor protein
MAMPIFWRLICGYSVILLLSVAITSYSVLQLGQLSSSAHTALNTENRMIGYEEKLTDVFLSEVRYAGKFIITHSKPLHDQLQQFKGDFARYMDQLKASTEAADIRARLARVEEFHARYHQLFDQEVQYLHARQTYAETRYREEKEKVLENLLGELVSLKAQLQKQLEDKLENIQTAAQRTRSIAIMTTIALLGFGIALCFLISTSIVKPLAELSRTAENTDDEPNSDLDVWRTPEIRSLAIALSNARRRLHDASRMNESFVRSITSEFGTPLISINKRLIYLKEELSAQMSREQTKQMEILAAETERLIRRFSELPQKANLPVAVEKRESPATSGEPRNRRDQSFNESDGRNRRRKPGTNAVIARAQELWAGSSNAIRVSRTAEISKGEKQ